MNHFDEEILLKYSLEILNENKVLLIKNHLIECDACTSKLNEAKKQLQVIGSFDPMIENNNSLVPKRNNALSVWVKRAAVLIIGFIAGYATSVLSQTDQVTVIAQNLITKSPTVSINDFTSCQKVDIR